MTGSTLLRCAALLAVCATGSPRLAAQNHLDHVNGHYVGILDFFNTQPADLKHLVRHPQPAQNGLNGPHGDGWIGDDAIKIRGLLKGAQLTVDWWTLFGDPVAAYVFTWQTTGRYEIIYTDEKKGRVSQTVSREKFAKFPALQKRFDNIYPSRGDFEILWRIGGLSGPVREDYKRRWGIFGSIGSAAPHINADLRTVADTGQLLFDRAGANPFTVPTAPLKGWPEFANLPASYAGRNLRMLVDFFNVSTNLVVNGFRATRFEWPLAEMKALAVDLARIEAGEEPLPPAAQVAQATDKKLPGYAEKDEWSDAAPAPAPPTPQRAADGRFYYCDASGNRVFPQGFPDAEPFNTGTYIVAKVKVSKETGRYNYIDLSGAKVLPQDVSTARHLGDGLFVISHPDWSAAANTLGLYDAVTHRQLFPLKFTSIDLKQQKDGIWQISTRKILSYEEHSSKPDPNRPPGNYITFSTQDLTVEEGSYRWDSATRQLHQLSLKTEIWEGARTNYSGPLY